MLNMHQRLGEYEIIRLLGKGGMGEVYEAQQFAPQRRVALKVLAPWLAQDEDALRRFCREAEVPAQLDHPNIVRIFATGKTEDGTAFYTMQMVRGISLAEMIRRAHEPLPGTISLGHLSEETPSLATPPPEVKAFASPLPADSEVTPTLLGAYIRDRFGTLAKIGASVARALAFAHRQQFVHRDLKPSNIMIDHHDQVYVVDFGLTRALEADGQSTLAGSLTGTPRYMSPEQTIGSAVDARSDIYSLGVTLFEMATLGISPYTANRSNREAVLAQIRSGACLPLRTLVPDIPAPLERIIVRAMSVRPSKRYADAAEMAADLEQLLADGRPALPAERRRPRVSARAVATTTAVASAAVLLLVLGFFWDRLFGAGEPAVAPGNPLGVPVQTTEHTPPTANEPALPSSLLERQPRVPINLFTRQPVEPIWSATLEDAGAYFALPEHLHLGAKNAGSRYLLALDRDPQERGFEFSVEMMPILANVPGKNELGAFFGWHSPPKNDPRRLTPYFTVNLDKKAGVFHVLGVYHTRATSKGEAGTSGTHAIGSLPVTRPGPWHALRIRAVENRVTIAADGGAPMEFDVPEVRARKAAFAYLQPRGAAGIWTNGDAMFRNAQVMALTAEKVGK
jgi:serine/threonine protein kinase